MICFLRWILKLVVILMIIGAGGFWLHQQGKLDLTPITEWFGSSDDLVTYYQWMDAAGELQISHSPPEPGTRYTQFKGSPGLVIKSQPKAEATQSRTIASQPKAKVIATHRDTLEEKLLSKEMTTQCRWLVSRIFELERQAQSAEGDQLEQMCREYREQIQWLPKKHCKASAQDIAPEVC